MADLNDGYTDNSVSLQDLAAPESTVSFDNFATSTEEITRAQRLEQAKKDKLDRLSRLNQNASFDNSYTDMGDGWIESNSNKLWNDLSDQEIQSVLQYGLDNYTLQQDEQGNLVYGNGEAYSGPTRRLYMFGTNNGSAEVKFGLARGDIPGSEARYQDTGIVGDYGWAPGDWGVNTEDKRMDVLLPNNVATMLEGLAHGRKAALDNRSVKDKYTDAATENYGSGVSEYYTSREGLFGAPAEIDQALGEELFNQYLGGTPKVRSAGGVVDQEADLQRIIRENQQIEAENADWLDRIANAGAAFGRTFSKEIGVDFADWVGESLKASTNGVIGWDVGTEEEKTKMVNDLFGFNPLMAEKEYEEAQKYATSIVDAALSDEKDVNYEDVYELVKIGITTPEMLGDSLGFIGSFFVPFLGWGGKAAKADKAVRATEKLLKAGVITKDVAKAQVAAAKAEVTILNKVRQFSQRNAGLMQVSAGNVNDQIDAYKEEHGVDPSVGKVAQMFATETLLLSLDRWADLSILKSPAALKGTRDAFSALAKEGKAKVLAKTLGVAGGLAVNMSKEAGQEYLQEIGQEFNVKFNFDDNGTFLSAVNEAGEVFLDRDMQIKGVTGAGLGAGGAVQFAGLGAIPKVFKSTIIKTGEIAGKVGEGIKSRAPATTTPTPEPTIQDTVVAEEDLTPEQVTERVDAANTSADEIVKKFSRMLDDAEFTELFAAETVEDEEAVETPSLKAALEADPSQYESSFKEIERAEAVISERVEAGNAKDTDEVSLKLLRKAKRQLVLSSMEDENQPTLGSGYAAEDVVETFLDTVDVKDGKLDLTSAEEKVLNKFVEDNDIPPLRFENLRKFRTESKDAAEVQEEALGSGDRSASSYSRKLRMLVNSANPSRKAVAALMDNVDRFLSSQETRKAAYEAVVKEVQADLDNYNRQIAAGKSIPVAVKKRLMKGKDVPGYKKSFVAVSEAADGTLVINSQSQAVNRSIQDNIDYLKRVKTRYGAQVRNILGDEFTSSTSGISVRPNSAKQDARDKDQKFYNKRGVTKAIVDENSSSAQWAAGGDYSNDNASMVNTGEYTEDDVVVVNSTAKGFKAKSKLRREIHKAYKAGATIVLDREVANNVALERLVKQYHLKKVEEDGVVKFMPEAKAKVVRDKQAARVKATRKKERSLKKLMQALEAGDQEAAKEIIDERFEGNEENALKYYENVVKKKTEELTKKLLELAVTKGFGSAELSEAMAKASNAAKNGDLPTAAVDAAFEAVTDKIKELEEGETLLTRWNEAQQAAKKGKLDFAAWIKENVANPMVVVKEMFKTAVGEGKKVAYVYYDEATGDFSTPTTSLKKIPEGAPYQVIELDPNRYATVSKTTPLNSFNPKELRIAGQENIAFNQLVATAVGTLKATLRAPDLNYNNTKNSIIDMVNSPAATLIFNKDLEVNETVAIAMQLGLNNFVKNSGYLLKKGKKSKSDIAEILGIDESQVSRAAVEMMSDKGLLYKTVSNSIGKDIASMLGLSRKSDSEADVQAYDALVADLGQTAILMGVKHDENPNGFLEVDNTLTASKFAVTVLGKDAKTVDDGNNAKVLFIQAINKSEDLLAVISEQAKIISESIPDIDAGRKEPSFKKLTDKVKKKIVSKIRKEKLGLKVPGNSQKALNELMDTEWTADLTLMKEMIENAELIKARLGYIAIPSDAYDNLSFEEKEVQEAINRGLDKSFEEMQWLIDSNPDAESAAMWFEYFFSKNGRFFIDSNTINPQTDKHLHRFTVQPKSHLNTFVRKGKQFFVGKEDVTTNLHYALSQAFGFATDKKDTTKIKENAEKILAALTTPEKIAAAKKEFLETGKYALTDKVDEKGNPVDVIEIEHLGHALQGFQFLQKMVDAKGGEFTSSITAEFDAVTSGFGLKNLQVPIINNRENWLKKVGVLLNTDEVLTEEQIVSMNDILDGGNVLDSYQTLASDVQQLSFEDMIAELPKKTVVNTKVKEGFTSYSQNLWSALSEVLPQVEEGKVSGALRTLFKYPFMTFNYSASIKSIRKNLLTGELLTNIAKEMAAADLSKKEDPIVKLMQAFVEDGDVADLQNKVRTQPFNKIKKPGTDTSIEAHLGEMIEASYGAQVENILTNQFKPFVEAQKNVNAAFTAMFEIFAVSFEKALVEERKKGPLSEAREKEIYKELKNQWPMIKGPLSEMEQEVAEGDGVGIYDTQTSSPYGPYSGRKPSRAIISKSLGKKLGKDGKPQQDIRVSQMVKNLTAAIAAGSVVPIHYIDGAIMAQTINGLAQSGVKGITSIHDAIMPSLVQMDAAQREYNKQTLEVNASYSFINEIMNTLDRFLDEVPLNDEGYKTRKIKVKTEDGEVEMPVKNFLLKARNDFMTLANRVNEGRESLYNMLNQGAKIMHMAGTPAGVYDVEAGSVTYKPVEKVGPRKYNTDKVNNKTIAELQETAKNLNCKGS